MVAGDTSAAQSRNAHIFAHLALCGKVGFSSGAGEDTMCGRRGSPSTPATAWKTPSTEAAGAGEQSENQKTVVLYVEPMYIMFG